MQPGHCTLDYVVLVHLAYKYLVPRRVLFAAFTDIKAAFDSVPKGVIGGKKIYRWSLSMAY